MREEFVPTHVRKDKEDQFTDFVQGNLSVEEYHEKFMELYNYCEDKRSDKSLARKFEKGLHIDIIERLNAGSNANVREVYLRAGEAERLVRMRNEWNEDFKSGGHTKGVSSLRKKHKGSNVPKDRGFTMSQGGSVRNYGGSGSVFECKRCPNDHPGKYCEGNLVECRECGKLGHRSFDCYKRQGAMRGRGSFGGVGSFGRGGYGGGSQGRGSYGGMGYGRGGYGGYGGRGYFGGSYGGGRRSYGGSFGGRSFGGGRSYYNQGGQGQASVVQGGGGNKKNVAVSETTKGAKSTGKMFVTPRVTRKC